MRGALLGLLLAALPAHAGAITLSPPPAGAGTADGGAAITIGDVATTADLTLFVDPTGSDSNACTASGSSACLTIQGALNKAPKQLRHQLTISIAAGTYSGATISGFTVDPGFQKTTAGILIDGALSNSTLATGSATGTATVSGSSAGTGTTFGTLGDTTATWTVNDLKGRFIVITGGTGSGQVRVITSNTATTLTIAGTWTSPNATSTYAIQDPSVVVSTGVAVIPTSLAGSGSVPTAGFQIVNNDIGTRNIAFRNVKVTAASTNSMVMAGPQFVSLLQVQTSLPTGSGLSVGEGSSLNVTTSDILVATSSAAISTITTSQFVQVATALIRNTSSNSAAPAISLAGSMTANVTSSQLNASLGFDALFVGRAVLTNNRYDCNSVSGTIALRAGSNSTSTSTSPVATTSLSVSGMDVTNCTTGVMAGPGASIGMGNAATFTGNALTHGVNARHGGKIFLSGTLPTITAGTFEVVVDDGALNTTFSSLSGASFTCFGSLGPESRVCRL